MNIYHILSNVISLEGITIHVVKLKGFFDGLRHFDAKFMGPFQVARIVFSHKRNTTNTTLSPQDVRNPPVESWFMVNAKDFGIFGGLNWV